MTSPSAWPLSSASGCEAFMSDHITLGELVELQRGTTYKSSFIGQPGPVLLGLGAIERDGGFRGDNLRTYGGDSPERLLVRSGGLFLSLKDVTQSADLLGAVARVPANISAGRLTQDTVRLTIRDKTVSGEYLYWMLRSPQYRAYCRAHSTGTTNLGLSRDDFFAFALPRPDPDREVLVSLLGALEEKIAANTKLARTADDLGSTLFVKAIRAASMSYSTFEDLCAVGGGGTPRTAVPSYWDGGVNWATPTDVTALKGPYLRSTARSISAEGLASCASSLYPAGSILMTSRATIGAFAIAEVPTAVNQGFIVVRPTDGRLVQWFFHEMRSRVDEFTAFANGATFLELSRGTFKRFTLRLADAATMEQFASQAEVLHRAGSQALAENLTLAATRDALLPQLMSRRLRVKDAEQIVGDSV